MWMRLSWRSTKEKFANQVGNDLNTSMAVTALASRRSEGQDQRSHQAGHPDSFDQVLSLDLLAKADKVREEQSRAKAAQTSGGYTVTGEGDPEIDALVLAGRCQEGPKILPRPTGSGMS